MLGDSLVRWAGERAKIKGKDNLGNADIKVIWDGHSSLTVQDLRTAIQHGILRGNKPYVIVLHVGGNNVSSSNTCQIAQILSGSIDYLTQTFPTAIIVWTYIIPRLSWRNTPNTPASAKVMDLKRKRINRKVKQIICKFTLGRVIIHDIDRLTKGFYRKDGVHLSDVGNDMYLLTLSDAIQTFLSDKSVRVVGAD